MQLRALFLGSLVCAFPLACGGVDDSSSFGSAQQALDNGGTSSPDRCGVKRDGTGEDLGEGTIDINGMCCVPEGTGKHCYGCGDGFTCTSIPSISKPPRKGPILVPPTPPIVKQ